MSIKFDLPRFDRNLKKDLEDRDNKIFKEAYDEGYSKGLSENKEKIIKQEELLLKITNHISKSFEEVTQQMESVIMKLLSELCKVVLQKELTIKPEQIKEIVEKGIASLNTEEMIAIHLCEDDLRIINEMNLLKELKNLTLKLDDSLSKGECLVSTDKSLLDLSIDNYIKTLC